MGLRIAFTGAAKVASVGASILAFTRVAIGLRDLSVGGIVEILVSKYQDLFYPVVEFFIFSDISDTLKDFIVLYVLGASSTVRRDFHLFDKNHEQLFGNYRFVLWGVAILRAAFWPLHLAKEVFRCGKYLASGIKYRRYVPITPDVIKNRTADKSNEAKFSWAASQVIEFSKQLTIVVFGSASLLILAYFVLI
jgi:hypothetical protein